MSNGQFGDSVRLLSHPHAHQIYRGQINSAEAGIPHDRFQQLRTRLTTVDFGDESSPLTERPLERMFASDGELLADACVGTSFTPHEASSVLDLVGQGKNLTPETIAFMYDRSCDESRSFLRRLAFVHGLEYSAESCRSRRKVGLEALFNRE